MKKTRTPKSKRPPPSWSPAPPPGATVGQNISDVATLSGLVNPSGGTVSFDLYKGEDCSDEALATLNATPSSVEEDGEYTSEEFDTTSSGAGTYHWIAHFSGDANNKPVDGECLEEDENTEVEKATPELVTSATASATVGQNISDVATLSGLVNPSGGTVSFDLYKGADCSGQKLTTLNATDNPVGANGDYHSGNFDTTSSGAGTYHWIAHFSGDANNNPVDGNASTRTRTPKSTRPPPSWSPTPPPAPPSARTSPTSPPSRAWSTRAAARSASTSTRAPTARARS